MDKPEVLVGSIEDEFKERVLTITSRDPRIPEGRLAEAISEFKTKIEEECWQAFELAQALTFGQEQSALDESKARHREEVDRFAERVRAFAAHERAHNDKNHKETK